MKLVNLLNLVVVVALPVSAAGQQRLQSPNIVVILADDHGFGDLSCNNSESKIQTPVLDRLARDGINFIDAHSPSGVCSPTRYGLLTGRYCWRTRLKRGVLSASAPPLIEQNRLTLPAMLREKGYETGAFGKWHLGRRWPLRDAAGEITPPNIDWSKPAIYCPLDAGFTYSFGLAKPGWEFMENRYALVSREEWLWGFRRLRYRARHSRGEHSRSTERIRRS